MNSDTWGSTVQGMKTANKLKKSVGWMERLEKDDWNDM